MNEFNCRDFVFLLSGAALGHMLVPGLATAANYDHTTVLDFSHSGLVADDSPCMLSDDMNNIPSGPAWTAACRLDIGL